MSRDAFRSAVCATWCALASGVLSAQAPASLPPLEVPVYSGPPLSLREAIDEALERNSTLVALRRQFDAAQQRPAQSAFFPPPTFTAQVWQWPINTLNPANTNMYMFTVD